jgi:hypothetical protein
MTSAQANKTFDANRTEIDNRGNSIDISKTLGKLKDGVKASYNQ